MLFDHGADVNAVDANGATSLMYAVQFVRTAAVKLSRAATAIPGIAATAIPGIIDKRGFDAFYLTQQLEDPEILTLSRPYLAELTP